MSNITNLKNHVRESLMNMVEAFLENNIPFIIKIANNNNWNKSLPENILNDFPEFLELHIVNYALEESYIDVSSGNIVLTVVFGEDEIYEKILYPEEIQQIFDINGVIIMNKPFLDLKIKEIKTPEEDEINKSMEMFKKNNPDLFKN